MFGALQVRVVLLYGVQGDAAGVARVAALQPCREKPRVVNCVRPSAPAPRLAEGTLGAALGGKTPSGLLF